MPDTTHRPFPPIDPEHPFDLIPADMEIAAGIVDGLRICSCAQCQNTTAQIVAACRIFFTLPDVEAMPVQE